MPNSSLNELGSHDTQAATYETSFSPSSELGENSGTREMEAHFRDRAAVATNSGIVWGGPGTRGLAIGSTIWYNSALVRSHRSGQRVDPPLPAFTSSIQHYVCFQAPASARFSFHMSIILRLPLIGGRPGWDSLVGRRIGRPPRSNVSIYLHVSPPPSKHRPVSSQTLYSSAADPAPTTSIIFIFLSSVLLHLHLRPTSHPLFSRS